MRQSLKCPSYSVEQILKIFTKSHLILAKECTCCCNMPLDLAISNLRRLRAGLRPPASIGDKESKQNSCPPTGDRNTENLHACLERKPCAKRVTHSFFHAWPQAHEKGTFHLFYPGVISVCSIPGAFSLIILKDKTPSLLLFLLLLIISCVLFVYPNIAQ